MIISDEDYLKLFEKCEEDELSKKELKQIIAGELKKPAAQRDADMLRYCRDALSELKAQEHSAQRAVLREERFKHIRRVGSTAAVIFLAFTLAILLPTLSSADLFPIDTNSEVIELYRDSIRVNFAKNTDSRALSYQLLDSEPAKQLEKLGLYPVLLPEALLTPEYRLTAIQDTSLAEYWSAAEVKFTKVGERVRGSLTVESYSDVDSIISTDYMNVRDARELRVNGVTVYIFLQSSGSTILYQDGNTVYTIMINVGLDNAIAIAETIK